MVHGGASHGAEPGDDHVMARWKRRHETKVAWDRNAWRRILSRPTVDPDDGTPSCGTVVVGARRRVDGGGASTVGFGAAARRHRAGGGLHDLPAERGQFRPGRGTTRPWCGQIVQAWRRRQVLRWAGLPGDRELQGIQPGDRYASGAP